MRSLLALAVTALTLGGCPSRQPVQCASDTDCDLAGGGTCAGNAGGLGWCAYPAGDCPSGYRYATDTGGGLGGICVENDAGIDTPDAAEDITPPTIVARSPDMAATGVGRTASVSVMFSEPIAPATVTATSFAVTAGAVPVAGQLTVAGESATFTPTAPLTSSTQYTVAIGTQITDLAGNPLQASSSWMFTTGTATWSPPVLLETETNMGAFGLRVASGGTIVVATWFMASCSGTTCQPPSQLWYSIRQGGVWSPGVAIAGTTGQLGDANAGPALVVDSSDRATVVFSQTIGSRSSIYASTYVAGTWSAPALIETDDAGNAVLPAAAVDPSGHVFAVWAQDDGTGRQNAMANRFVPGTGWGSATPIEQSTTSLDEAPNVAAGATDSAFATWKQGSNVVGVRYAASAWGPTMVAGTGVGRGSVVIHTDGAALAVWPDGAGVSANRNTGAWAGAQPLDSITVAGVSVSALGMSGGNAIAIWEQTGDLWQARFVPATGWGSASRIEAAGGTPITPGLAFAADGSALATWTQPSPASTRAPWANVFSPATGWGAAQLAKPDDSSTVTLPRPFVDPQSSAFGVVWLSAPSGFVSVFAATLQ